MRQARERSSTRPGAHGTLASYTIGFVLSVMLTVIAYLFTQRHVTSGHTEFSHHFLVAVVIGLAIAQLAVQLEFFLHLAKESAPRLRLLAFLFMLLVVVIIVAGSLWIMNNLNYHMMAPDDLKAYMHTEEGL